MIASSASGHTSWISKTKSSRRTRTATICSRKLPSRVCARSTLALGQNKWLNLGMDQTRVHDCSMQRLIFVKGHGRPVVHSPCSHCLVDNIKSLLDKILWCLQNLELPGTMSGGSRRAQIASRSQGGISTSATHGDRHTIRLTMTGTLMS